ncbi:MULTISPECIES: phosphotransferase family protein [unclassified Shewanella]|uniref:phosphotransferase family protein n=1 Tax=unclassified Shewanella TaxID=196818 RepID=UPI000C850D7F|nr:MULTISPECIES: phosphotransferase family protein [unclassified Shewanella]MDO6618275.1 phosphotransferase family protein [Shewanella sp. 6_MG-2023]MDO6641613.1 phosphotransferase family protein [Shewanella sp. 5_MG-2023]PMH86069.1 aminoglycoside phosphotransferase [Shewanella sp. 10N.286.48.B5]PMH97257.1 aminoglycoside phosphotransferase [Shewanella sp. 10N.286.48.A6]
MLDDNLIDLKQLTQYLERHIAGFKGPITLEKFAGGQSNPTFKLQAATGNYVLRRQPPGKLLKSAHAVDREYKVIKALQDTKVPVAKVYHLCEDPNIIGSMFYVMEYCDGTVYWSASLSDIATNEQRTAMYDEMNKVLVALHSVDVEQVGLSDYGKAGNYFERQLARWTSQYRQTEITPIKAMNDLSQWLEANLPNDDGRSCLVHGDFRLDNMMFAKDSAKVIALLDWELSTLGHPYADLAYQCMQLRMPAGMGSIDGLKGVDRTSLGIPTEEEYVARYCQRMGIERIENWVFYLAFSFFRLAAIAQGVAKRASQGNASNENANKVGAFVEPLAKMALQVIAQK